MTDQKHPSRLTEEHTVMRAALKRVIRHREISLNPHQLAREADKLAKETGLSRYVVLDVMRVLTSEVLHDSFEEAITARREGRAPEFLA